MLGCSRRSNHRHALRGTPSMARRYRRVTIRHALRGTPSMARRYRPGDDQIGSLACAGSIFPSPRVIFLNSARLTDT